jgi:putative ABC transport system permease protein
MPRQYNHIYQYDLMTVALSDDNETLVSDMEQDASVTDFLNLQIDSIQIKNTENGEEETAQLYVVPTGESLSGYILLESLSGEELELPDTGVFVTQNLSDVMDFDEGDTLEIQNLDLDQAQVEVSAIVHNYLGNAVYMSQEYYERLFGPLEANSVLCHLSDTVEDHTAYADKIASSSDVITCVSTQSMREEFSKAFGLINSVVVLVTTLAAALAFVVLFTLSTTNISERERELATIKVLGFFDGEVHLYVNKETIVLTLIGILFGLPLGRFVSGLLTSVLKMPAVYFAVSVHPFSYVFAAGMTFVFALAVNLITNRSLDHINMVDALKSIE